MHQIPDSKLHWPHIGPTWILSAPRWAKVDPTCFAIGDISIRNTKCSFCRYMDVNLQIHACLHNFFMPKIHFRVKADFNEGQFTEVNIRNNCLAYDIDISCINESIFIFKSEPQYLVGFCIILKQTYNRILPISRMLISSNLSGNPLEGIFYLQSCPGHFLCMALDQFDFIQRSSFIIQYALYDPKCDFYIL